MNNRIIQLDALRGIAAMMVVGYHYTKRYQNLYGHPIPLPFQISFGDIGVQLFFMISGFVIFMTLERTLDFRDFLVSRFARLYPAYWCSVLLTFTVISIFSLPGREVTLSAAIINLSMLQDWFNVPHVDGVYWTLTQELSFYAIMLMLFLLRRLKQIETIAVGWLFLMIIVYATEHITTLHLPTIIKISFLLNNANLFIAGIMFYRLQFFPTLRRTHLIIVAALLVQFLIQGPVAGIVCSFFFLSFYAVVFRINLVNRVLSVRFLTFLGTISYSLYLLHQNIGYVILRTLYAKNITPMIAINVALISSVLLATSLNVLVETPIRKAIRVKWKMRMETKRTYEQLL